MTEENSGIERRERKFRMVGRNIKFDKIEISKPLTTKDLLLGRYPSFFSLGNMEAGGNCEFIAEIDYTGLKDENGVGIYEGNIVKAVAENQFKDEDLISDVIFKTDLQWQIRSGKKYEHGLPLVWGGWVSIEIIGNIFENKDLLK